jgi:DNA-binding CsgD family transcriptional regulator
VADPPLTTEYVEKELTELGTPCLEIVRGGPVTRPKRLAPGSHVIGRDDGVELSLPVTGVSRKHARVTVIDSGEVSVTDLGSRNGTFLNGRRVESASLRDGDELRVGPVVLRFGYVGGGVYQPSAAGSEAGDSELSPRELEVARLVAEGLTNADVGKRLHISPATVGRHLSNIYQRLGIHSRAALTKYVLTQAG